MFRFFLFLKGYLLMEISGYGAERFINLCKLKNICLWELKPYANKYLMKISASDFNRLEEIIHKTDVKVDILKKYGLPFFFQKKHSRAYNLFFLLLAVSLIFISNLFIWKIEFSGNLTVSDEQIADFLKVYDVDIGSLKASVEFEKIEKELRKEFSIIKWCSVSVNGNTLSISIEENSLLDLQKTENGTEFSYSDILASADGVIEEIMVRNGVPLVNIGDTVTKGQILVTGAVPIYNDSLEITNYHYYDADADILLKTTMVYQENLNEMYSEKEYTGRKKKVQYFKIYNKDIHVPFQPSYAYYDIYTTSNQIVLFDTIKTPVYYGTYEAREYIVVEKKYTKEEIAEIANTKLNLYYESLSQKGVQILQKDVKIEYNANNWGISGDFVVNVAQMEKIYREQVENTIQ